MPEPISRDRRYLPGLDGVRAVAVTAVILYHLGFGWATGGLLGVGVFFTLSGYLITDLLVAGLSSRRMRLTDFWLARARRLLPALLAMLAVVAVWVWVDDRAQLATVRDQTLAALIYMSNWWQTLGHQSYFARFGAASPLNHLWSLSVEEQFYVVWPCVLILAMRWVPERTQLAALRPRLAGIALVMAIASALEMALLYHPTFDPSRLYYGTDTRAFGLLFGAALALVWPSRSLGGRVGARAGDVLDLVGVAGLIGIVLLIWRTNEYSAFLYRGGMVLLSLSTVMVIAAVVHPAARVGRWLGSAPLRWVGARSYGIYLWHAPVITLTTPAGLHHVQALRAALQVGGSVVLAALSWRYLEQPIRHGAIGRLWARWRRRDSATARRAAGLALTAAVIPALAAGIALAGALRSPRVTPVRAPASQVATTGGGLPGTRSAPRSGTGTRAVGHHRRGDARPAPGSTSPGAPRTSCRRVVQIGDSTSEGMISHNYLPDHRQRLGAQLHRVGVRHTTMEITGGTSIIETLQGDVDALAVARRQIAGGYHGCWVIALGTNDSADVFVGSHVSLADRISRMMSAIGAQPVMWETARTLLSSGPYAESGIEKWNSALLAACARHPHMRVYDWAGATQDSWYIPDGIHYYSEGYAARAHLTADALAKAFPGGRSGSASCEVTTPTINLPVKGAS
jgi:peptidoglycan/LPS O-acetylase OafA/YrhL